jgi:hypothetical protein
LLNFSRSYSFKFHLWQGAVNFAVPVADLKRVGHVHKVPEWENVTYLFEQVKAWEEKDNAAYNK